MEAPGAATTLGSALTCGSSPPASRARAAAGALVPRREGSGWARGCRSEQRNPLPLPRPGLPRPAVPARAPPRAPRFTDLRAGACGGGHGERTRGSALEGWLEPRRAPGAGTRTERPTPPRSQPGAAARGELGAGGGGGGRVCTSKLPGRGPGAPIRTGGGAGAGGGPGAAGETQRGWRNRRGDTELAPGLRRWMRGLRALGGGGAVGTAFSDRN